MICNIGFQCKTILIAATVFIAFAAEPAFAKAARDESMAPDPYEKVNRVLFYANGVLDFLIIRPASMTYKRVMPRPIRDGLRNAFSNMDEPAIAINDIFQGHGKKAVRTVARFATNSTIGIAGIFDVATAAGFPHHRNDFGITLARGGLPSGPYLFLPIIGPATTRDAVAYIANIGIDPFTYLRFPRSTQVGFARTIGSGLNDRAATDKEIKVIVSTATDDYASIKAYFLQNRESQIAGDQISVESLPNFDAPLPKK